MTTRNLTAPGSVSRPSKRPQNNRNRIARTAFDQVRSERPTLGSKPRCTPPGPGEAHEGRTFRGLHVPGGCTGLREAIL